MNLTRALSIEGWMNEADLAWLATKASDRKVIVEVGCFLGRSTTAMLDNSDATVFAFDDFYGPREPQIYYSPEQRASFYGTFMRNMADYIESGRLMVHRGDHGSLWMVDGVRPDMVFIDGCHDVEAVKRDIGIWVTTLQPNGLLCGHDYNWWPSVKEAVDSIITPQIDPGTDIWYTVINEENPRRVRPNNRCGAGVQAETEIQSGKETEAQGR